MTGKENPEYVALTAQALEEDRALMKAMEPPPPPPPPVLTTEQQAGALHSFAPGAYLYGVTGAVLGPSMKVPGCGAYLDELTRQAGPTTDPIEQMLVQQLVWAYHAIGVLHVQAGSCKRAAEVTAYHAAVARLMAEFRRSSLALKAYRQGPPRPRTAKAGPRRQGQAAANGNVAAERKNGVVCDLGSNRLTGYYNDEQLPTLP
jgi:hypothetical protein